MIALAYAVPTGVIAGWTGVLDMILTPAKVSQVGGTHTHTHTRNTHLCICDFVGWLLAHCYLEIGGNNCANDQQKPGLK